MLEAEAASLVDSVSTWRHRIEVAPGVVTPGTEDNEAELSRLAIPGDLADKNVLDVGCSDGFYSFFCERQGARVTALDDESSLLSRSGNGFRVAKSLLGSDVDYRIGDVEQVVAAEYPTFDCVLFINVLYHLPDPHRALAALASVTRPGGLLVLKTYYRTDVRVWVRRHCLGFDLDRRPKWWYFPGSELGGDPTNWWAPNRAGLLAMLSATGWAAEPHVIRHGDRLYVHARRVADRAPRSPAGGRPDPRD